MKTTTLLFLSLIALWTNPLLADRETIYVDLAREIPLERIYIDKASGYLSKLTEVLSFDFDHNGRTKLESNKAHANYELHLSINETLLKCQLVNTENKTGKTFDGIALSMDPLKDRQAIHRLSDTIFKTLYQEEGIASTRFVYTTKHKNNYELWEADYDGENRSLITRQREVLVTPCLSSAPQGKRPASCLFTSYIQGEPKLFLSPLKEFKPKRISLLKGNQLTPAISKQNDKIAFISDTKGNPDLYLVDLDPSGNLSTPRRIYGFPKAAQSSPTFSPDGKKIAFVSNKDGFPRIYSLPIPNPDQKIRHLKPELLTTLSKESTAPAWSPDGQKLAYCARDNEGVRQIYIYDFGTKREKQLTQGPLQKENPTWASNSLHLLYNTVGDNESTIYMINLNEKESIRIPLEGGIHRFPSWS